MKALRITLRRLARRTVFVAGVLVLVTLVALVVALAYLKSAAGRHFLATKVNDWVSRELVSELRIERIEVLSNDRLAISGATLLDAKGRAVLTLHGLDARFDAWTILTNLLEPTSRVLLPEVHVARLEVELYRSDSSGVSLAEAFDTRPTPEKTKKPSKAGRGPRISIPKIVIDRVSARTDWQGLSQATAELAPTTLNFDWSPQLLSLGIASNDARMSHVLSVDAKARVQAELRFPGKTSVTLDGTFGALPIHGTFQTGNEEVALELSSPSLTPDAMSQLISGWPLGVPLSARVELAGSPSAMHAKVETTAGGSKLTAAGPVSFTPHFNAELALTGSELSTGLFAAELVPAVLDADARLELSFDSALHATLNAHVAKGTVQGVPLPETNLFARYEEHQVSGRATSVDPALPVSLGFKLFSAGKVEFSAEARDLDMAAVARYGLRAQGRADFDATGELAQGVVSAQFEARVRTLIVSPLNVESGLLNGELHGAIAHPGQLGLKLAARGTRGSAGTVEFPSWALESKGTLERQLVSVRAGPDAAPLFEGSTTLAFGSGVNLFDTRLAAQLNGVKHSLELKSARVDSGTVALAGLHWQVGTGTLTGSALLGPAHKSIDLELSGFAPQALLKTLALDDNAFRGRLGGTLRFEEDGRARNGHLSATLEEGALPGLDAVRAQFEIAVVGRELEGQGSVNAPALGQGKLSLRGALGQGALDWQSLSRVLGELRLDLADIELDAISRRWLPPSAIAIAGRADASLHWVRSDPSAGAIVGYELRTRDLALGRADGEGSLRHGELSSRGELGATESHLELDLKDAAGTWLSASVEHSLGFAELLEALGSSSTRRLIDAPFQVAIEARPRSLELLGGAIPHSFGGNVSARVGITGSIGRPEIEGSVNATSFGSAGTDAKGNLDLNFDYSAERERYAVTARYADRTRAKLEFSAEGHWSWMEHGFGRSWSARGEGKIAKIELGPVAELLGVPLTGEAAGQVALRASPSEFEAIASLDLRRLALERQSLGVGQVGLRVHQGLAEAKLSLDGAGTSVELAGEVGLGWDGAPCIDPLRAGSLDAKVRNFQLAAVAPLLRSVVSDLRGPLSGFMSIAWDPADAAGKQKTRLRADAIVSDGSVTLASGAGSIQCAKLRALGDGANTLHLAVSGCARSTRTNLWASADLPFNGVFPQRVAATLYTDPGRKDAAEGRGGEVPVTFDGVILGNAKVPKAQPIQLVLDLSAKPRALQVNVPALEFALPEKDDTRLVELDEDPAIVLADAKAPPVLQVETSSSDPWSLSVKLGQAVKITQPGMKVPVTGALTQGPDGLLDGNIVLPEGGVVPQLGQIFRLKRGSIRFQHQPLKEGALNIEAATRTAEGVVVELYASGTVEKPVIRLRSDPPRSENDIIALLLGVQGSDTVSSNGKQGTDLRGSATALAMNQLLRGSKLAGLQFGAGQTHQGDSVSTVSMRWLDTVWIEGRTVRSSTQRAANSTVQASGVIDWRFARGFSLRTQLGNNVSGLELRWSHRY